jgi:hypothetical protein
MRRLNTDPGEPGAWNLHANFVEPPPPGVKLAGMLDQYARQLCSETLLDGKWQKLPGRDNHLLDCEAGQLVVADLLGLRYLESEPAPAPAQEEARAAQVLRPDPGRARQLLMNRRNA